MRRIITGVAIASMFLMSLLALGSSATLADSGNGAVQDPTNGPINVNDCNDDGTDTICYTAQGEQHTVSTASGGINTQVNLQSQCVTVTENATGAVLYSDCFTSHIQLHTDNTGEVQVNRQASTETDFEIYGDTDCFAAWYYHKANGQVQYNNFSYTC